MVFRNTIPIQNLKCNNCAIALKKEILQIQNISKVYIHSDYSHISFNHTSVNDLSNIENMLTLLGFPPVGEKIKKKNSTGYYCNDQSRNYCVFEKISA